MDLVSTLRLGGASGGARSLTKDTWGQSAVRIRLIPDELVPKVTH